MMQFDTLDDAILELYIRTTPKGGYNSKPLRRDISMARCDYNPVTKLASQIKNCIGFTFAQQNFAIKLITKYKRQWKKLGYDISNINKDTPLVLALRELDRSRIATIDKINNIITLQFLYHPPIVALLYSYQESRSAGKVEYNKVSYLWELAITLENIDFVHTLAKNHKFIITQDFQEIIEYINTESNESNILLDIKENELVLENAPESMTSYISENLGSVKMSNFLKLAAYADQLSYLLSSSVNDKISNEYNSIIDIIINKKIYFDSDKILFDDVLRKINMFDYDTIVIYSTVSPDIKSIDLWQDIMPEYTFNIIYKKDSVGLLDTLSKKTVILTNKVLPIVPDLVVSLEGFAIGPSRKAWFNAAAKNIYYCEDIDIKIKKAIKKNERNINNTRRSQCKDNGSCDTYPKEISTEI